MLKLRVLAWLILGLLLTGCSAIPFLQGKVRDDLPLAPEFVLQTTQGERCALADHRGKVVALYLTNL